MKTLIELPFIGTWKSFKAFKRTGNVQVHSPEEYMEVHIDEDRNLTIKIVTNRKPKQLVSTSKWQVKLEDKRHVLVIPEVKTEYEVITINHTVMVLMDRATDEKIFFKKDSYWQDTPQQSDGELVM